MVKNANNIIAFPKKENFTLPKSFEEVEEALDDYKHYHVGEALDFIIPIVFNQIQILGFQPPDNEELYHKDAALIVESIKSFLYKLYDIEHPFHDFAEIVILYDEEEGLSLDEDIKIEVTKVIQE